MQNHPIQGVFFRNGLPDYFDGSLDLTRGIYFLEKLARVSEASGHSSVVEGGGFGEGLPAFGEEGLALDGLGEGLFVFLFEFEEGFEEHPVVDQVLLLVLEEAHVFDFGEVDEGAVQIVNLGNFF